MTPLAEATLYAISNQNQLGDLSPKLVRLKISQIPSLRSRCALLTEWGHKDVGRIAVQPERDKRWQLDHVEAFIVTSTLIFFSVPSGSDQLSWAW